MARTVNLRRRLLRQAVVLGSVVGILWLLEIVDALLLRGTLDGFGLAPRSLTSVPAVLVAPFRWRCHSQLNMKNVLSRPLSSFGKNTGPVKTNPN